MATKLLLINDVEDLGRSGEIVSVKPGYARNFLLPQQKAVVADKQTIRMQAKLQEERAKQAVIDKKDSEELAKKLEGVTLSTVVKVDQEGHMFGSVTQVDIQGLLEAEGFVVTKKMVLVKHPFKQTGVYKVDLKLKEDVPASVSLKILPDQEVKKPEPQEAAPAEEPQEAPAEEAATEE